MPKDSATLVKALQDCRGDTEEAVCIICDYLVSQGMPDVADAFVAALQEDESR